MADQRSDTQSTGLNLFAPRASIEQVEEGDELAPKFDENGLIPVVTTDAETGEVLMHGYMNAEALEKTIQTGEAHYWSRSRQALWHKGATSGLIQKVVEIRIDDDLAVELDGDAAAVAADLFGVPLAGLLEHAPLDRKQVVDFRFTWKTAGLVISAHQETL